MYRDISLSMCVHTGQAEKFAKLASVGFRRATFGMLMQRSCQLSYEAKSVRMNDISELTSSFDNYMFLLLCNYMNVITVLFIYLFIYLTLPQK